MRNLFLDYIRNKKIEMIKLPKSFTKKVPATTLQEVLIALVIIGIIAMIAVPRMMPLISRTKSLEAQSQLEHINNLQTMHRYVYSKYSLDLLEIDFEAPKTVNENGTANYVYEIVEATTSTFKARATAVVDFDGDGVMNIWEIDENGVPNQVQKD